MTEPPFPRSYVEFEVVYWDIRSCCGDPRAMECDTCRGRYRALHLYETMSVWWHGVAWPRSR